MSSKYFKQYNDSVKYCRIAFGNMNEDRGKLPGDADTAAGQGEPVDFRGQLLGALQQSTEV